MNAPFRKLTSSLLAVSLLFCYACSSDTLPEPESPTPETPIKTPEAYQDKIRTQPYPKADNELFLNPAPLIVPQAMKTGEKLQFSLSQAENFNDSETLTTAPQQWCMYNPHRQLKPGTWYWRFRNTAADGSTPGTWSQTYSFEVKDETPVFLTPAFSAFLENAPRIHPRLYCFLNGRIDEARRKVTSHPEYRQLQARAAIALATDYTAMPDLYSRAEELRQHATYLYQAYYLTESESYATKLHQLLQSMIATPPSDSQLFADNFTATNITLCHIKAYDLLYSRLSEAERTAAEDLMLRTTRYYYNTNCGYQENHIFDNHFWQQNMRILFQAAFMLYDKPAHSAEILPILEYYYELWTARAPASGFNRDGIWHNGTGYFSANVKTLAYIPALFSYVSRKDFLQHPWYKNAGRALSYTFPPNSKSNGFGDNSEKGDSPNRLTAAFADYLARETGDSYAGWYAGECQSLIQQDYELRLYRMCADRSYHTTLPTDAAKLIWYKDAGEVAIHSNLGNTSKDLALSFRSSTFGSGSHTTASQNAFNLLYKGTDVYRSTGYYQNFSDAHNLMSYRHSRAHNTILVNGIGQPYSTKGYGNIMRAMGGSHISYCLGDASHAYNGISDDPMWVNYFAQAGITQSAENGFGKTPLTKYRRHILMLHPNTIVIYDELEAASPVQWSWLLHSPTEFQIDHQQQMFSTANADKSLTAVTQLFSGDEFTLSQTDQFVVPPASTGPEYPDQWHLTAHINNCPSTRFLAIIQVRDMGDSTSAIRRNGDVFSVGDWNIEATLDTDRSPRLLIRHRTEKSIFCYGADDGFILEGSIYFPKNTGSSVLYDQINDKYQTLEMVDQVPISTRVMN